MTTSATHELTLTGEVETLALGRALGRALAPAAGGVLCLSGHLGAGKTTLVKGLAEGLGVARAPEVTSPTFLRVVRFEPATDDGVALVHVDAYRMKGPQDVVELGLDVDMAGGACVALEWPQNVAAAIPGDHLRVALEHVDEGRRTARLVAGGQESAAWLARFLGAQGT